MAIRNSVTLLIIFETLPKKTHGKMYVKKNDCGGRLSIKTQLKIEYLLP